MIYVLLFFPVLPGVIGANCDSVEAINPGFGETYFAANSMIKDMNKNMDVNLQYKARI